MEENRQSEKEPSPEERKTSLKKLLERVFVDTMEPMKAEE